MPLKLGSQMPSLDGATEWIYQPAGSNDVAGRPVLVYFWAVSCYICKNNIPTINQWKELYQDTGLQIVSVHMPRQESDTDMTSVRATAEQLHITDPLAVDGYHEIGDRFQTGGYWPHYFLFDGEGTLRSRAAGDVGLAAVEKALVRLRESAAAPA